MGPGVGGFFVVVVVVVGLWDSREEKMPIFGVGGGGGGYMYLVELVIDGLMGWYMQLTDIRMVPWCVGGKEGERET